MENINSAFIYSKLRMGAQKPSKFARIFRKTENRQSAAKKPQACSADILAGACS
jgi:hypothetical protein